MVTPSLPLIQKAQILGDTVYSPMTFAKILGISKQELLEKEAKGIIPPAKRNSNQERYYKPEDVSQVSELSWTSFSYQIDPETALPQL